jgi:hypothetical protein
MVDNFLFTSWNPKNITIGLFGVHDMSGDAMIVKPKKILYTIWTHTKDFGLCQS